LLVAFEKWFDFSYKVIKIDELPPIAEKGIYYFSFNSINAKYYTSLARSFKSANNSIKLIAGGPHPSARPYEMAEIFDKVCVGEGEIALKRS